VVVEALTGQEGVHAMQAAAKDRTRRQMAVDLL
jgi:hypothetical protein